VTRLCCTLQLGTLKSFRLAYPELWRVADRGPAYANRGQLCSIGCMVRLDVHLNPRMSIQAMSAVYVM
jgi:hypothetical protein